VAAGDRRSELGEPAEGGLSGFMASNSPRRMPNSAHGRACRVEQQDRLRHAVEHGGPPAAEARHVDRRAQPVPSGFADAEVRRDRGRGDAVRSGGLGRVRALEHPDVGRVAGRRAERVPRSILPHRCTGSAAGEDAGCGQGEEPSPGCRGGVVSRHRASPGTERPPGSGRGAVRSFPPE